NSPIVRGREVMVIRLFATFLGGWRHSDFKPGLRTPGSNPHCPRAPYTILRAKKTGGTTPDSTACNKKTQEDTCASCAESSNSRKHTLTRYSQQVTRRASRFTYFFS